MDNQKDHDHLDLFSVEEGILYRVIQECIVHEIQEF